MPTTVPLCSFPPLSESGCTTSEVLLGCTNATPDTRREERVRSREERDEVEERRIEGGKEGQIEE